VEGIGQAMLEELNHLANKVIGRLTLVAFYIDRASPW